MKIKLNIKKIEELIQTAKYKDIAYEPGRSKSSVKYFEVDVNSDDVVNVTGSNAKFSLVDFHWNTEDKDAKNALLILNNLAENQQAAVELYGNSKYNIGYDDVNSDDKT